ncbi:hypothetical protein ACIPVK_16265 [Paeniglutamicibacter sp. MACA_103]|uniref:hypothetical protein n=1 Tax=Paeniglutamicibacter sp. MACA_103 TaxID=3377337 RepID=UPI003892FC1F
MLAQAAAPAADAAPANPLAALLGGVLPLATGVIGYLVGFLRDANRAKADREARHQEQVLEAAIELLGSTAQLQKSAAIVFAKMEATNQFNPEFGDWSEEQKEKLLAANAAFYDVVHQEERKSADRALYVAMDGLMSTRELTKPHALRISILAPSMESLANEMVNAASHPGASEETDTAKNLQAEYAVAREAFANAVRSYLKVPTRGRSFRQRVL